jgi:hypothetical protein
LLFKAFLIHEECRLLGCVAVWSCWKYVSEEGVAFVYMVDRINNLGRAFAVTSGLKTLRRTQNI